ncbi:prohead protease/major capsid protein fusion protein [Malikia spinosa]|uniref:prohead protease/major capsid protein fusion protein n=1 Tax=Malikia spinosa TaxID=86180 RepID=UPI002FDB4139
MQRELPMQMRQAAFQPATLNEADRTVELVWTTGASVRRMDFWTGRAYYEELSLDPEHIDLTRLNNGAPLLNSHSASDLVDVIGVVERAWLEGNEGRAVVRIDAGEIDVLRKVKDGILRNVSVGYAVRKYQIEEGDIPVYRAIDWEPMELSLVPIGADAGAGTRAAQASPCEFITHRAAAQNPKEKIMPEITPAPADLDAIRAEAALAERARVSDITTLCERHAVAHLRDGLVNGGTTLDNARGAILEAVAARDAGGTAQRMPHVVTLVDETDTRREAVENAILHRATPGRVKLTDAGRQYRGLSLIEMGREMLEASGESTRGMDKLQLAQRALSTSDFPIILANVANKTLRAGYEAAPQTFKPFTKQTSAPDFKTIQRSAFGDAPTLKKVNEHGEFTVGTIGEGKESYQLATYGRIVSITRQTIINDDLGAFADLPGKFGRAAADLESDIVWGIITANAAMNDTYALFHANHGNLAGTNAAIAVASLGLARAAMRKQTSIDGNPINVSAAYLLVPAALELVAQQYTSADFVSAKSSDINPFKGTLQVIAEPRLDTSSATAWYLASDPMQIDTIEYSYLEGNEGVYIETRNGFEVDGLEIKARLDFAAKAIDHRGLFKNIGA